ncbi:MAG: ABC transporter ATP-binding protein [Actinoplanes sp.]
MIEISQLTKRYGRGRPVLSGADLTLRPGESVAVLGANGSGKSTLLRMIAGVTRPSAGTITGVPEIVGYVPDRFPATDALSSLAYLTHLGRIRGLATAASAARARELLARLELTGGIRTPIRALSKGNAQKVALSQALMVPPGLLVLDEPWSGLDQAAHGVLAALLSEVLTDGGMVVYTDHGGSMPATLTYTIASR